MKTKSVRFLTRSVQRDHVSQLSNFTDGKWSQENLNISPSFAHLAAVKSGTEMQTLHQMLHCHVVISVY